MNGRPTATLIHRAIGGTASLFSLRNAFRTRASIQSPYRESGWVHALLKPIAMAVRQVPIEFWIGDPASDKGARRLERGTHPLPDLFAAPNPLMTMAAFFEATTLHRKLDGADVWILFDKSGKPIEGSGLIPIPTWMFPIRGRSISYRVNKLGFPEEFSWSAWGGGAMRSKPEGVVCFRDYDPDDPLGGLSDIDAALNDIDLDWQAQRYQRSILENSGDPGGVVKIQGQLAPNEERSLEAEVNEEFSVQNAGRWRVMSGQNVEYIPNKLTPRDMEYSKLQAWIRDKLAAITGVPLPIVSWEHATLNNYTQAVAQFWEGGNGVLAFLDTIEDVINHHFLPRLDDRVVQRGVVARFNVKRVRALRENRTAQMEVASRIAAANIGISFEEAVRLVGLDMESTPYSDVHLVPFGLVPIEDALEGKAVPSFPSEFDDGPEPAEEPDEPEEDPAEPKSAEDEEDDPDTDKSARRAVKDDGFEERTAYWHALEKRVVPGRDRVRRAYLSFRKSYEAAQMKRIRAFAERGPEALRTISVSKEAIDPTNLRESDVEQLLLNLEEWIEKMREMMRNSIMSVYVDALEGMAEELGTIALTGESPRVISALQSQLIQLSEGHASVLAEKVRGALLSGLENATSTGELQSLVAETLPAIEEELSSSFADRQRRAQMIARTETAHASNTARFEQMKEDGVTEHQWISSRDPAVRGTPGGPYEDAEFSHYELDGEVAEIGKPFDQSKHPNLKYPCDPQAEPGDSINCRCVARAKRQKD